MSFRSAHTHIHIQIFTPSIFACNRILSLSTSTFETMDGKCKNRTQRNANMWQIIDFWQYAKKFYGPAHFKRLDAHCRYLSPSLSISLYLMQPRLFLFTSAKIETKE